MANQMSKKTTTVTTTADVQNTPSVDFDVVESLQKENESLKIQINEQSKSFNEQLEAIKQMLAQQNVQTVQAPTVEYNRPYSDYEGIRPDKYIKVMSLTPNLLTLHAGHGKFYRFPSLGSVMNIMYGDLVEIVHNHFKLATEGSFYIFDERAVDLTGLKEYYQNILTKEGIDLLLDYEADEIRKMLNTVSDFQKSAIADYVVEQIVKGKDMSTSKVDVIRELSHKDIMLAVDEMRNFDKEIAKSERDS